MATRAPFLPTAVLKCSRPTCGYRWVPRLPSPKKCPKCQNPVRERPKNTA